MSLSAQSIHYISLFDALPSWSGIYLAQCVCAQQYFFFYSLVHSLSILIVHLDGVVALVDDVVAVSLFSHIHIRLKLLNELHILALVLYMKIMEGKNNRGQIRMLKANVFGGYHVHVECPLCALHTHTHVEQRAMFIGRMPSSEIFAVAITSGLYFQCGLRI